MFSVVDGENSQSIYRISVEKDVKFAFIMKEGDDNYTRIADTFFMNEIVFKKGSNGIIDHSIIQNVSSGKEKCKFPV